MTALKHPEYLNIRLPDGGAARGADQDWYRLKWQRMAGCGPTAASVQLACAARAWDLPALCPLKELEREPFVDFMEEVWRYVTPGFMGLNKVPRYVNGIRLYAQDKGVALDAASLEVPCPAEGPGLRACADFIRAGLEEDCPVAFLNLHNGEEKRLDMWHWVLVTGLRETEDTVEAVIADSGKELTIDLGLWRRTARDRGGFVRLTKGA